MNAENETTVKMYRSEPARLVPMSSNNSHKEFVLGGEPFTIVGRATSIVQDV
jgi:repressor LexA